MFSQIESGRQWRKGGIGIGLSIAKEIVEMHGGTLTVESAGPWLGSTFVISLPLSVCSDNDPPTAGTQSDSLLFRKDVRILILDDNIDAARMLASLFESSGHIVQLAYSGADAISKGTTFHPEIAFLDIGLPDMSRLGVAQALRKQEPLQRTTLVAVTGWGSEKDQYESEEAGFDFHLTKPVTIEAIRGILPALKMPSGH